MIPRHDEPDAIELRKQAHEAPLNIFHKDHDGHCWVEITSYAWRDKANEYMEAIQAEASK